MQYLCEYSAMTSYGPRELRGTVLVSDVKDRADAIKRARTIVHMANWGVRRVDIERAVRYPARGGN